MWLMQVDLIRMENGESALLNNSNTKWPLSFQITFLQKRKI